MPKSRCCHLTLSCLEVGSSSTDHKLILLNFPGAYEKLVVLVCLYAAGAGQVHLLSSDDSTGLPTVWLPVQQSMPVAPGTTHHRVLKYENRADGRLFATSHNGR